MFSNNPLRKRTTQASLPAPATTGSVLECVNVGRTYPGPPAVQALRSATLSVRPGDFTAIIGRSGSGKSTLLTLLGLLDAPTSGTLTVHGHTIAGLSPQARTNIRRQHIGFVFQTFNLVPTLSCLANVGLALRYAGVPRSEHNDRSAAALKHVGLGHRLTHRVRDLSGGETQRVAIARAMVKQPSIILADEPTGNLDTANESRIIDLLHTATQTGAAVIIVTHSTYVASRADHTITISDGVANATETPQP